MKLLALVFTSLISLNAFAGTVWCKGKTDYQGSVRDLLVTFESGGNATQLNVYDISSDLQNWLVYDVSDHELIGDGSSALITLDVNEKESGLSPVNHDDWELKFQITLIPNRDPDFLREFSGKLAGKPISPAWLNCEMK